MDGFLKYFLLCSCLTLCVRQCISTMNIALHKPAKQVGTWMLYGAELAVDGNTDQELIQSSCAHPSTQYLSGPLQYTPAWWSVDLSANSNRTFIIRNVTIYFRSDCCEGYRIYGNKILVSNGTHFDTLCEDIQSRDNIQTFQCAPDYRISSLTIRHEISQVLGICEVIISGYEYQRCMPGSWGENCTLHCDCSNTCNDITGSCTECPAGRFGKGCIFKCNCLDEKEICMPTTGACPKNGCAIGFSGMNCSIAKNNIPRADTTGIIAGILVALILVVVGLLVFVFVKRYRNGEEMPSWLDLRKCVHIFSRKERNEKYPETERAAYIEHPTAVTCSTSPPSVTASTLDHSSNNQPDDKAVYANCNLIPAIPMEELGKYIQDKKKTPNAFKTEFTNLPSGSTAKWDVGNNSINKNKNRFLNIRAYDHSRVTLEPLPGDIHSDYINAAYLDGYGGEHHAYIASQGPKKGQTVADMWRMVWQTNSNRIIMVTNLVEGGKIKCEQYWPNSDSSTYGDIKVTIISEDKYAPYVIRMFNMQYKAKSRRVHQFHFTSWPDHGVPTMATDLLEFRKRVKSFDKEATGPLIIHCSAGVGRTGTYIAVDYCLQQAKAEGEVNIWELTRQMRQDRVNMIQTLDQYIFVYDAIHEALASGETSILASQLQATYSWLCEEDPDTNQPRILRQFKTLKSLKSQEPDKKDIVGRESENVKKNRFEDIVPSNQYRPFLTTQIPGTTNYINAVYVNGFRTKLAYLVTQMPLPHTVVDFWRLIYDHHSSTIIMLSSPDKNAKDVGIYWPNEVHQTLTFGPLSVTMSSVDTSRRHIIIREFKVTTGKIHRTHTVQQFQLTSWTEKDVRPRDYASTLEVMSLVEKWQQQTGNGPVSVHCMDGASLCGMLLATMYTTEQLKVDQEIDVYRAVKQIRISRPQFIRNIDQYKFIHEMMIEFISNFGEYSNFL